jgi:hypothetical protein
MPHPIGECCQQNSGIVPIEDEPEEVLPNLFTECLLLRPPGSEPFQNPTGKRDDEQPKEVATGIPEDL